MWEKFKKTKFAKGLKEMNRNRAVALTSATLLMVLAVIIAVTAANNRAKQKPLETAPVTNVTEAPATEAESDAQRTDAPGENTLPTFTLPVTGKLSQKHDDSLQVFSPTMEDYRVHLGIDIVTAESAPVYAAADGKVTKIWNDNLLGTCISVSHSGDCVSIYKNLATNVAQGIEEGVVVHAGQLLGTVGDTAMAEIAQEPHLHFEILAAGKQTDPLSYFSKTVLASLDVDASFEDDPSDPK